MKNTIKRVYTGLPEHLVYNTFWVEQPFRTNELSHKPGGFDVVVEYNSGKVLGYEWIKRPFDYISKIFNNIFLPKRGLHFQELERSEQFDFTRRLVKSAYGKVYEIREEAEFSVFEKIWDLSSAITLVEAVGIFEEKSNSLQAKINRENDRDYRSACNFCSKDCGKCFQMLDEILEHTPNYRKAILKKLSCANRTDYDEIVNQCNIMLAQNILDDTVLSIAGKALYKTDKFKKSFDYFTEALEINKNNADALLYKSRLWEQAGEFDKAILFRKKFIEIFKGFKGDDYYALGKIYEKSKQMQEARKCFVVALDLFKSMQYSNERIIDKGFKIRNKMKIIRQSIKSIKPPIVENTTYFDENPLF